MKSNKINILFYGDVLLHGVALTSDRSGIFFTASNILQQFIKRQDVNVSVLISHITPHNVPIFREYMQKEFPGDFSIIDLLPNNFLSRLYVKFYDKQVYCQNNKMHIGKFFWKFIKNFIRPLHCFITQLRIKGILQSEITKYDIFFSPDGISPIQFSSLIKFTMLYDCIPHILSDYYGETPGFASLIKDINHDEFYFADSASAMFDFIKICPQIDLKKITVTHLACNDKFKKSDFDMIVNIRRKYNIPDGKKYIFSLCTLDPRKNLIRAVKTFIQFVEKHCIDDLVFVLGGGHLEDFLIKLKSFIADLGICKDKIILIGYVDDEDVPALYSGAEWFIYTSQYEGFGLPPLEAMSCGCPVITSNNSSLPEVVGDAGIMIDYDSDEQHVKAYEDYYFNPSFRSEYIQKGLARSQMFSWEKCVDKMVNKMKQSLDIKYKEKGKFL